MIARSLGKVLLLASLVVPFIGCNNSQVDSISVTPGTQSLASGQTVQFTATALVGHAGHAPQNVTNSVTWASSSPAVATISASGLATAVGSGTTTITATTNGFGGTVSGSATLTVTGSGGGGNLGSALVALAILPGSQVVSAPNQTSQFLAIGTTSTGGTQNVTGQVAWNSSSKQVATISSAGLATGVNQGTTTITAIATNPDNSVVTATATFTVTGGASEPFTAISISPGVQSLSATGQTAQFIALATSGSTGLQQDVTNSPQVVWTSSVPTIASVTSYPNTDAGLVSGVSQGQTTITAKLTNPDGSAVTSTASVTINTAAAPEPLLSLAIIPAAVSVGNLLDTGQFIAIGTFSTAPTVKDLTNDPSLTWISSDPLDFPINTTGVTGAQAGVITAAASGAAVVIAEAKNPDGSLVTATATFTCPYVLPNPPTTPGSCYPGSEAPSLLATLTIFNSGPDTTDWLVTAPSATGTADVIHCGPGSSTAKLGGSVCVGTYPVGTTVQLTATSATGAFGGWSSNCTQTTPVTALGPNTCSVTLTTNDSVGAIFNTTP